MADGRLQMEKWGLFDRWPMQAKTAVLDVFAILVIITARYKLISIKYG